jgi:hypothetical protein
MAEVSTVIGVNATVDLSNPAGVDLPGEFAVVALAGPAAAAGVGFPTGPWGRAVLDGRDS